MRGLKLSYTIPWILVGLIIFTSFAIMTSVSNQESAIMDELAHIPAGYGYVRYLDYRLNPEHPPLVKAIATLPLLFGNFNFPTQGSAWQTDINGQWDTGSKFLYSSGNDPDKIIQWARIGPMLITLLLIFFIYLWAQELVGSWWALIPALLFGLSPTVLEHGHFVTTDLGAAFGVFISLYYLVKYLLHPSKKSLIYSGIALGLAELLKFSTVLLIPLFVFLAVIFYIWKARNNYQESGFIKYAKSLWSSLWRVIVIFVIAYILVYAVYFLFTINYPIEKQTSDTAFTLTSFAGGPDKGFEACQLSSHVALSRRIRCLADVNIALTKNSITRPIAEYMLGVLMVIQRSSGGNTAYFLGQVSSSGWWYYFPVLFILKEPIPCLILIGLALLLALWGIFKKIRNNRIWDSFFDYIGNNFAEFSMISFVIFYWAYSIKSPLNIGIRHILPTFPLMYILATGALRKWVNKKTYTLDNFWKNIFRQLGHTFKITFKAALIAVLLIWFVFESILAYPYYLSYFNEFAGGTQNGYKYVTDSNYDWGQDLKRLVTWADENHIDKIGVDYFGGGDPGYYLGSKAVSWNSAKGDPKKDGIDYMAISVNSLEGAKGKLSPGQTRNPQDEYLWITNPDHPFAKAGTSIFIYKL